MMTSMMTSLALTQIWNNKKCIRKNMKVWYRKMKVWSV